MKPRLLTACVATCLYVLPQIDLASTSADILVDQAAAILDDVNSSSDAIDDAGAKLNAAVASDSQNAKAQVQLARYLLRGVGDDEKALADVEKRLKKALAIDGTLGYGYTLLGSVYTRQHRAGSAREAFASARKYSPSDPWRPCYEADLLQDEGKDAAAVAAFLQLTNSPSTGVRVHVFYHLSDLYTRLKQFDKAKQAYLGEIEAAPNCPYCPGNYSQFLRIHLLDLDESEKWGRRALLLLDSGWGRSNLGLTLYLKWAEALIKDRDSARADLYLTEAKKLEPDPGQLLYEAARYPRLHPIVEALKRTGYSLDRTPGTAGGEGEGTTPLISAVAEENIPFVKQLIQFGANVNMLGYLGVSPVKMAVMRRNLPLVQVLLEAGADPRKAGSSGKDARWYAETYGYTEIAKALDAAGPKTSRVARTQPDRDPNAPFRVGYVYRTRTAVPSDQWSDGFPAGDQLVFLNYGSYGDAAGHTLPDVIRCDFRHVNDHIIIRTWGTEKNKLSGWSQYFEEIGPLSPDLEQPD